MNSDKSAIHVVVDNEYDHVSQKATPADADRILIEDSEDSFSKKLVEMSDIDDADAIHDNVAGEISAITEKATPVNADLIIIEDSAASNAKKKAQLGNLPGGTTDADAIHDNVAGEISAITEKASPASGDWLLIEDAADSDNKKKVDWGNLPSSGGGGDGGMEHIQTETISSTVTSVDVTGIAQTYRDLIIIVEAETTDSADQDFPRLQVGDASIDTGTNYVQRINYEGTSSGSNGSPGQGFFEHGPVALGAGDSTTDAKGFAMFRIVGYAESAWTFVRMEGMKAGDSYYMSEGTGIWRNTDPVSRFRVSADGGDLTGGRILLFGIGSAL